MSELAKNARKAMHAKIKRITKNDSDNSKHQIDASDFAGYPDLNSTAKTGARPISRRQFRKGGKVVKMHGEHAKHHAGRKARKSGGKALTANSLINRNVREANEEREGIKHIGAFNKGGKVHRKHREDGGFDIANKAMADESARRAAAAAAAKSAPAPQPMNRDWGPQGEPTGKSGPVVTKDGKKHGGKIHKADGGSFVPTSRMAFSGGESRMSKAAGLNKGGRAHKMGGGMMGPSQVSPDEDEAASMVMGKRQMRGPEEGSLPQADPLDEKMFDAARSRIMMRNYKEAKRNKAMNAPPKGLRGVLGLGRKDGGKVNRKHRDMGGEIMNLAGMNPVWKAIGTGGLPGLAINALNNKGKSDDSSDGKKSGGKVDAAQDKKLIKKAFRQHENAEHGGKHAELHLKKGGYAKKARGGSMSVSDGALEGTRPTGGRLARKHGGSAKGKMNVNIIIAQKPSDGAQAMHPPGGPAPARPITVPPAPPPGAPPMGAGAPMPMPMPMPPPPMGGGSPMPPPPMGRKHGGKVGHRSYKSVKDMDAGAGGGEGRMEKIKIYGLKPSQTTKNY